MDRFLPFIQKVPLFIQCLFSIWHDQMLSTSPTANTPELLLLYHELKHAVLLRLTEVKTGAQEQCMCYFQRDFFKRVATSALTYFKDHLPTYLLNAYMKSSIILFTTIILFGVSVNKGAWAETKKSLAFILHPIENKTSMYPFQLLCTSAFLSKHTRDF